MIATSFLNVPYNIGRTDDQTGGLLRPLGDLEADRIFVVSDSWMYHPVARTLANDIDRVVGPCQGVVTTTSVKSMSNVHDLARELLSLGCTRRSVIVACGGGHVGNIAGLTAALLFRGIRLVHVPTTLLAASDSVLSSKQAVNLAGTKNLLGTYHTPSLIWANTDYLDTLDVTQRASGIAELYKNALAIDPVRLPLIERLASGVLAGDATLGAWQGLISAGIMAKGSVMYADPYENGPAVVLEYGHTVGHALEACTGWPHGLAVAFGMQVAAVVAARTVGLSADVVDLHARLLRNLWATYPGDWPTVDELMTRVAQDNKRGRIDAPPGTTAMVLLADVGQPVIDQASGLPLMPINNDMIRDAIQWVLK